MEITSTFAHAGLLPAVSANIAILLMITVTAVVEQMQDGAKELSSLSRAVQEPIAHLASPTWSVNRLAGPQFRIRGQD